MEATKPVKRGAGTWPRAAAAPVIRAVGHSLPSRCVATAVSLTFDLADLECTGSPRQDARVTVLRQPLCATTTSPMRLLTAIPVHNEEASLVGVLTEVLKHAGDVLVVDDGSTDRTPELLNEFPTVRTIRHPRNLGYGAGLRTAFQATIDGGYDGLVTLDCDGQHEPERIPEVASHLPEADIVSGSRYLRVFDPDPEASRTAAADQRRSHALAQ